MSMHIGDIVAGAPIDRRSLARGGAALGAGLLGALALSGCSALGIEDPNEDSDTGQEELPAGAIDFRGLVVALDLDQSTWAWGKISSPSSSANGSIVVGIPVTATNNDEQRRVVNSVYNKLTGPDGLQLADISAFYSTDDLLQTGGILAGDTVSRVLHVLYSGEGTYTLEFDNLIGNKASLSFEIGSAAATGLHPIPDDALSADDAASAFAPGTAFQVGDLMVAVSPDTANYWWTATSDPSNAAWNGRAVVGVHIEVANNSSVSASITADMYGLFAPELYRLADPAQYYADISLAYTGPIAPGASVSTVLFWPYVDDGTYYAVFDNGGVKAVASVVLSQWG